MNRQKLILLFSLALVIFNCKNENSKTDTDILQNETVIETSQTSVNVIPISHGTFILESEDRVIYIDPTGGKEAFSNQKAPTLILITDIHSDHLDVETLKALEIANIPIIAPAAVVELLPETMSKAITTLNNGESYEIETVSIEAIPMYNLREEALKFHPKGRGNGYLLNLNGERIYISGDTEDIPEMRNLENIDKAFICMNLPYTMSVESAASAVLDFEPKRVYPYHYRGTDGLSDVEKFKKLVNKENKSIVVQLLKWYD
ncbi:L-ascorbate metabolism protein UlaG (beta-lactamase superfamily) [Winogradskyella epiphytica]|uniref:L-ascorbate metabolism protein UlaG (Beta-lactamase superfamily) n=1 Tax=Winogradskyella epiphytica TaxID=262005 RepID=A0A2V4YE53_9FLAO|nr:MBL fold metallo-hydrolase [Winogradskyella epiphytica]PYE81757.1 L-ascorbate metabolism protein UlaG (beta-lactamase superfamily) [Winogradskyella epiphytica]GGW62890.1 metal-dependent hydrolase [Winogradskyella epiphytica]